MQHWFAEHSTQIYTTLIASTVVCAAIMVVVGIVLVRVPPDQFTESGRRRDEAEKKSQSGAKRWLRIGRNILGWLLIAVGIAMLLLPGPGGLVILIGIMLADFPGKYKLQRWIITRGKTLKAINALRKRFNRPPLEVDQDAGKSRPALGSA